MIDLNSISRSAAVKAPRIVLYGVQGIGKTTLAASAPSPVFIPCEDGLASVPGAAHFPVPNSYADVLQALDALLGEHDFGTLVIDSLDALELMLWSHLCATRANEKGAKVANIEDYGYGKGYVFAGDLWSQLLRRLDQLRDEKGMIIMLIAHSAVVRVEPPDGTAYDRYDVRVHKRAAESLISWADAILFANYKVRRRQDETRDRVLAVGDGERALFTSERPAWRAKNRYAMPPEISFEWASIVDAIAKPEPQPQETV